MSNPADEISQTEKRRIMIEERLDRQEAQERPRFLRRF